MILNCKWQQGMGALRKESFIMELKNSIIIKITSLLRRGHHKAAHEAALNASRQYGFAAVELLGAAEEELAYAAYSRSYAEVEATRDSFRADEAKAAEFAAYLVEDRHDHLCEFIAEMAEAMAELHRTGEAFRPLDNAKALTVTLNELAQKESLRAFVLGGCICSTARDIELVELDDGFPCLTIGDIGVNPVDAEAEGELTEAEREAFDVAVAGDNISYDFLHKDVKLTKAEKKAAIKAAASDLDKKVTRKGHAYGKAVIDAHLDKRQIQYQSFVLSGGGQDPVYGNLQSTSFGMNALTERYYEHAADDSNVFAFDKGTVRLFNNVMETRPFTREMILVDSSQLDESVNSEFAESIKQNFLTVKFCPDEKTVYVIEEIKVKKTTLTRVFTICKGIPAESVEITNEDDQTELEEILDKPGEVRKYGMIYAGPSNQRRGNYILFLVHDGEDRAAFMKRMHDDFDMLTGGLLTTLEEHVKSLHEQGKDIGREKLFKLNSRISLAFTPTTKSVGLTSFAYYNGALGSGFADGMWLLTAELLANYYNLPVECVCGLGLQARILNGFIGKGMAVVIPHLDMAVVAARYKQAKHVSHRVFRQLWIDGKLEDDTMYFVGGNCPQAIFDENSMKAVTMTPEDGKFYLRIMSVKSPTSGKLNIQNAVAIQHLDGAPELIMKLGKEHVDKKLADLDRILAGKLKNEIELTELEQKMFDVLGIDLGARSVVNPDQYYPQLVADICPGFVAHDTDLFRNIVQQVAKGLVKDITKFNFDIPGGAVRYLQSDLCAFLLGKGVLNEHEVYIPNLPEGAVVDLTRNPKADPNEHYMATNLSLKTILARIDAIDDRKDIKTACVCAFKAVDVSLVIVPATKAVADSLGGADFDGDLAEDNQNDEYTSVQAQQPDGSNDIPKAKPSGKTVESFDIETVQDMFIDGLFGQKMDDGKRMRPTPIGIIANHATLISALLVSDDEELEFVLEHTIRPTVRAMGIPCNGQPYQRHFTEANVKIYDHQVVAATLDFYESDLSVESFRNALMDASREGASVEGRCIDQNKTGEPVHTGYLGALECKDINGNPVRVKKGTLRCKAYDTLKLEVTFPKDESGAQTMSVGYADVDETRYHYVKSKISFVRDELKDYLVDRVNAYLAMELEPSEVESTLRRNNYGSQKICSKELIAAKMMHDFIMRNNDLTSEDEASLATEEKKEMLRVLANTIRAMFDENARVAEKFVQIRKQACREDKDGNVVGYSSFEYVLREEFLKGVLWMASQEGWKINDTIGYKAEVLDDRFISEGEEIYFVNGKTEAGEHVFTDRKVNGFWTMKKIGGAWYATQKADEYFKVPKVTDERMLLTKHAVDLSEVTDNVIRFTTQAKRGIVGMPASDVEGLEWDFYTPWHDKMTDKSSGRKIVVKRSKTLDWAHDGGTMEIARIMQGPDPKSKDHAIRTIVYGRVSQGDAQQADLNMDGNVEVNFQ